LERAVELVREGDAPAARASVLAQSARFNTLFGEQKVAIDRAQESLGIAETLGRNDLRAKNLITLGTARYYSRDFDPKVAIAKIREGIELATGTGDYAQLSRGLTNLTSLLESTGELMQADTVMQEASRLAQRRGHVPGITFTEGNQIDADLLLGRWESGERRAKEFLAANPGHYMISIALYTLSMVELASDETDLALRHVEEAIEAGRRVRDPQALVPVLAYGAFVHAELGDTARARALLGEIEPSSYHGSVAASFFAAARVGLAEESRLSTREFARETLWDRAGAAVLDGRWGDAADAYDEMGAAPFAALAALRGAESFAAQGRSSEANEQLMRALPFWRSIGAKRYVREGEALLAKSA
jgi:tetratricopeptide (TPR) repeat protein